MTNKLKIVATAQESLTLVRELKDAGLVVDEDFEFSWYPSINDRFTGPPDPSYVLFTFKDESTATFYQLKWS